MKTNDLGLKAALRGMHVKNWEERIYNGRTRVVYVRYQENPEK